MNPMNTLLRAVASIAIITTTAVAGGTQVQPMELTIDDVVARVLARNLSVEAAKHRLEAARAERIAARLRPNPSLTVGAEDVKVSGPTPAGELYEVSTTVSQPIELGDKRQRRRDVAELTVAVAEVQVADALHQRLVEAKRAFYEGVLARDVLARARTIRDSYDQLVGSTQSRFDAGDEIKDRVLFAGRAAPVGALPSSESTLTFRLVASAVRVPARTSVRRPDSICAIADQLTPEWYASASRVHPARARAARKDSPSRDEAVTSAPFPGVPPRLRDLRSILSYDTLT